MNRRAADADAIALRLRLLRAEAELASAKEQARRAQERAAGADAALLRVERHSSEAVEKAESADRESQAELARLQASVSFRLGKALVQSLRSPRALVRLPLELLAIVRRRPPAVAQEAPAPDGTPEPPALVFQPLPEEPIPDLPPLASELVPLPAPPEAPASLAQLRVAAVLDPFSAASFAPDCRLLELCATDWPSQLREFRPHLLLVESAWLGRDEGWKGLVDRSSDTLRSLVASCRQAGIPTAFWNKEDPLHFEAFLEAARLFDVVFSTDADSLPRYRAELGHQRVHLLPFALQPRTHHPVQETERRPAAFFAGAWYGHMDQRSADFRRVADAVSLALPLDIYDRNLGSGDSARRFPEPYGEWVRGSVPYAQTPALYRSYLAGLNLNTIKDSPSMFARRVFELIGCNTSVYGNFARGLRMLLGELTIASDDPEQLLRAAWDEAVAPDAPQHRVRRLLALRKVLEQHTWADRLRTIAARTLGLQLQASEPEIVMLARADDAATLESVLRAHAAQRGRHCRLAVQVPPALLASLPEGVEPLAGERLQRAPSEVFPGAWLAPVHARDHYGPDYLRDLALGWRYTDGDVLGKAAFHRLQDPSPVLVSAEAEYRRVPRLALRRALFPADRWTDSLSALLAGIDAGELAGDDLVSLDALSYAEGAASRGLPEFEQVQLDPGLDLDALAGLAERRPAIQSAAAPGADAVSGRALSRLFNCGVVPAGVSASPLRGRLEICSLLPAEREDAIFSMPVQREAFERNGQVTVALDARNDPGLAFYLDALDAGGRVLARTALRPQVTASLVPPEATAGYRLAASVRGRLLRHVDGLWFGRSRAAPLLLPGDGRLLLVANGYPEVGNLYRNAFLHRRVLEYRRRGVGVDVVVVSSSQPGVRSYEFEGVPVLCCGPDALRATLASSTHAAIAVHFLDEGIWSSVAEAAATKRTVVWVHGAEIQPWTRRTFNHRSDDERAVAIADSDRRVAFWRGLLADPPEGLRLAFVSRSFAEDCWHDLGLRLPEDRWCVIHNPVDTGLFEYHEKPDDQRFNILSIRPHGYRIYGNDLVAATIRELSGHALFPSMQFRLIGDGVLFDENFAGLEVFPNVRIERRFLRQSEVAALHRQHGIFLVPTRGDSQGVSRDEAMASGLVPVTNDVGAVSEFADAGCAVLAPADDVRAMAEGLLSVVSDAARFRTMSRAAADRVRRQSGIAGIVDEELDVLGLEPAGRGSS
jgi:glycosyltransferase involved in cell wall biosynthesis/spore maturation protein CgeB